ncbi:GntR family transcriptional regulator [Sagittula salina]|uniref:GntR family transcriptional regulator n=1 Tax=Sagittula salina TaxID=2820268 RepID=A0A940MMJ6_9RHOB|nr:GntR family transcriptional regulator [Sagittula salina]MBP0482293.1 GntR family transcriptional regulator [Sagittula salina]
MTDRHALPLYLQISEMLIREINAGRLADGERLPPERDYAARLGISVGTLRKALEQLVEKGLLERVQGSGNYIRAQADVQAVYAFFRVELLEGGGLPTAQVLDVATLEKPADLPPFGTSDRAHRIRRLRRLNKVPAILEEVWLDASYVRRLSREDLSESLYLYYREKLGLTIHRVEDRMGVAPVPDWAPQVYGLAPGTPTLCATRISFDHEGRRAEVSRGWIDTSVATYVARLK